METFTKKKPTDELFVGEISLKSWVNDSLHGKIINVVDINLLQKEDAYFTAKEQCVSSVLSLAMQCTRESAEERINIKEALTKLLKIRNTLLTNIENSSDKRYCN